MRQELSARAEMIIDIRYAFGAQLEHLQQRIQMLEKYGL